MSPWDIPDVPKQNSYVKAFRSYCITAHKCMHIAMRGHCGHVTKTASHGHTILSTTAENPMLHTNFMGLSFTEPEFGVTANWSPVNWATNQLGDMDRVNCATHVWTIFHQAQLGIINSNPFDVIVLLDFTWPTLSSYCFSDHRLWLYQVVLDFWLLSCSQITDLVLVTRWWLMWWPPLSVASN